jgi:hypothetical protein
VSPHTQIGIEWRHSTWAVSWKEINRNTTFLTFEKALLMAFQLELGVYLQDSVSVQKENKNEDELPVFKNLGSKKIKLGGWSKKRIKSIN